MDSKRTSFWLNGPSTTRFTSIMNLSNLVINKSAEGTPVLTNSKGEYQFHFERPYAEDAAGNITYSVTYKIVASKDLSNVAPSPQKRGKKQTVILGLTEERFTDSSYTLITEVDPTWLLDPKRIYPVRIDPTVVHNTSSAFATGSLNRVFDTGSGNNPNLTSYYHELPADAIHSGFGI